MSNPAHRSHSHQINLPSERTPLVSSSQRLAAQQSPNDKWDIFLKRIGYYVPAFDWIPQYSRDDLGHDAMAGFTLACLLIPQSIGYASQLAGIPVINGLYSAAIPAIVYPLLCTGRHVSVGPEAALSLLVGHMIKQVVTERQTHSSSSPPSEAELLQLSITVSTLLTFETGLIAFAFGFFRLGFLDAVLSKALLRGFVTAIGCVIAIEQLIPMLGLSALAKDEGIHSEGSIEKLIWALSKLGQSHKLTCLISLVVLVFLLAVRAFKASAYCKRELPKLKYLPEILLTAALASFLTDIFDWDKQGVVVLGAISASEVEFGLPWQGATKTLVHDTLGTAFTLCVCGLVDSIVSAKGEAARYHYSISANRELVALGAANIATSCVRGDMPAYGSITRSRLNASTGARTPMASIITGLTIIFASFFLLDYLFFLPKCVLAVVIALVVVKLFSEVPEDVMFFWRLRGWSELGLMTFTFLLTLAFDVKTGIIISVAASLVLTVKDATTIRVRILGRDPVSRTWEPIDPRKTETEEAARDIEEEIPGVLIVKIRESLSFANVGGLKERLRRLEMFGARKRHPSDTRERENTRMIVFHLGDVEKCDASALQILKEVFVEYIDSGVAVWICHVKGTRLERLRKAGIVDVVGQNHIHPDVNQVLKEAQAASMLSLGNREVEVLLTNERAELLPS